jgi:uncharacterized protein YggE
VRRALIIVLVCVLLVVALATTAVLAFRGDGDGGESSEEPIQVTPPSSSSSSFVTGRSTAEPIARLPGITVIGSGEVEVEPDTALVRLTVGSGSAFEGPNGGNVTLADEDDLDPVVEALADAGAPKDDIYVNTFGGSAFGPDEEAAVITLEWPRPREVKKILATAQRAIRKQTDYNLQGVAVVFMRDDCDGPDEKQLRAALADAQERAERLASLAHVKLGRLIAVSEATAGSSLSEFPTQGCGVHGLLAPGFFEYQSAAATADKMTLTTTLEVTFAVER